MQARTSGNEVEGLGRVGRFGWACLFFWAVASCGLTLANTARPLLEMDPGQLQFDWFEESESFASIAVVDILQDRRGFVWVGTRDGIYRYDGSRFLRYRSGANERRELPHNQVVTFYEDSRGAFWVGLQRGIVVYDPEKDRFEATAIEGFNGRVTGFAETEEGELLFLGEGFGLGKLNEDGVFRRVDIDIQRRPNSLVADPDLGFLVGGSEGVQVVGKDLKLKRSYGSEVEFLRPRRVFVRALARLPGNRYWLGTNQAGSWILDLDSGEFKRVEGRTKDEDLVGTVLVDAKGDVWVGTTAGLTVFSSEGERKRMYRNLRYSPSSIQPGTVYALTVDRQGNLWVGSSRGGLSIVRNSKAFSRLDINSPLALSKRKVTSIFGDSAGRLWVGYHNEGVDILDLNTSKKVYLDPHDDERGAMGRGTVWDIQETSDGKVWVGANREGLCLLEPVGSGYTSFVPDLDGGNSIQGFDVRVILPDQNGNLWLGVHGSGFDYFDREEEVFVNYRNPVGDWVEDLALERDGSLWIGASDGLSYLKKGEQAPVAYTHDEDDENSISDNHVVCLFIDSLDTLWVGTRDGLCFYDRESDGFVRFSLNEGLPSTSIRSIRESKNGELWVATSEGLARFDRARGWFRGFRKYDGLLSEQFVARASYAAEDGTLYFGCEKGVVMFRPEEIEISEDAPDLLITGVSVRNVLQDEFGGEGSVLRQTPFTAERIVLPPGNGAFGFEFAALDYLSAGRNEFEYRLDGFDDGWVKNGRKAECYYTNIPPGKYVFRVRASNSDGVWNEEGVSLAVVLQPFYWQTYWFKFSVVGASILFVAGAVMLRLSRMSRQKEVLVRKVSERTRKLQDALDELEAQKAQIEDQNLELIDHRENLEDLILQRTSELQVAKEKAEESDRLKSAFLENISHEIRTPMNAIIGFVNVLRSGECEKEEQEDYLKIIEENGEYLIEMIDDIIELSLLESEKVVLEPEPVHLHEFFEKWKVHLKAELLKLGKTGIGVRFQAGRNLGEDLEILVDRARLDQVVGQLLENAAKFTDEGVISLEYEICQGEEDTLLIGVEDTGVGIPKEKLDSIFDLFRKILGEKTRLYRGTGLGLAIARRVVSLMNGEILVESEVGRGTRFIVRVPLPHTLSRSSSNE